MTKFTLLSSIDDLKKELLLLKEIVSSEVITPRVIAVKYKNLFGKDTISYPDIMKWFRDMYQVGFLGFINKSPKQVFLKDEWRKKFKNLIKLYEEVIKIKSDRNIEEGIKSKKSLK